ncbi:MAG: signal peptidase I [Lachnospiraceae bacterium]|nr:signal peptidase I [Lachnospiraceae bacterium]
MSSRRRKKRGSSALSFSFYVLVIILLTILLRYFVVERVVVVGESMEPTLDNGDNVLIDKLSARLGKIDRYDIVVFPADGVFLIKRVYGLPGENIRIDDTGLIYINDKLIDDRYAYEIMNDAGRAGGAGVTLADDEYFVLGDNRNNSIDSRSLEVGSVRDDNLRGRVMIRLTPLDKIGKIR